jgi:hypothetical protein
VTNCDYSCQTLRGLGQRVGLRVHRGPHRERHVGVAEPRRDRRGRHMVVQVHDRPAGMPGIMQPDAWNVRGAIALAHILLSVSG